MLNLQGLHPESPNSNKNSIQTSDNTEWEKVQYCIKKLIVAAFLHCLVLENLNLMITGKQNQD